jgi:hypothetical protein
VPLSLLSGDDTVAATLSGYGAITPDQARRIAADPHSTWRRLLTDPASGRIVDYGRTRYRTPAELAEVIRLRDGELRPRPHHSVRQRGQHLRGKPRSAVPPPPPAQDPRRVGSRATEDRRIRLDHTRRASDPHRRHRRGERRRRKRQRCGRRGHRDRHGPTAVLRGHTATGRASESR